MYTFALQYFMKKKVFYRITSLILAILMFFTSVGFSADFHFCKGELQSFSFLGEAESCHTVKKSCPNHVNMIITDSPKKDCCSNKTIEVDDLDIDFNVSPDVELTDIIVQLKKVILPGNSKMFIATTEGKIFVHENTKLLNKSVTVTDAGFTTAILNQLAQSRNVTHEKLSDEDLYIYVAPIKGTHLNSVVFVNYDSVVAPLYDTLYSQLLVTFIAIAVCAFLLTLLCRVLFIPLANVSDALALIAQGGGDLTQRIDIKTNDEVGELASNFNTFVGSLQALIVHVRGQAGELEQLAQFGAGSSDKAVSDLNQQKLEITLVATAVTEMTA